MSTLKAESEAGAGLEYLILKIHQNTPNKL